MKLPLRLILLLSLLFPCAAHCQTRPARDPIRERALSGLRRFAGWLRTNHVRGYIGEVGWPDNRYGDADRWNATTDQWFREADADQLWVTVWATGESWRNYILGIYTRQGNDGVNTPNSQASVLEAHLGTPDVLRGVNVAGAEFDTPSDGSFSNVHPGVLNHGYHYDGQATFDFLASRGIRLIRLPFRWERIQRSIGGDLDAAELGRLKATVARAEHAGLRVIIDMHNYGEYRLFDGTRGVRRTIGSDQVPITAFTDVWRRLSNEFHNDPNCWYGLMNEPHDFPTRNGRSGARIWEDASQAAVDAIRIGGDNKMILVAGYAWSSAGAWPNTHPKAWINDPANNFRYEAHEYWDANFSGTYRMSYARETAVLLHPTTRPSRATTPH